MSCLTSPLNYWSWATTAPRSVNSQDFRRETGPTRLICGAQSATNSASGTKRKQEAARFLLRYLAEETAGQRIDVLAGARLMYRVGWFPLGQSSELNELLYLLILLDEMPEQRGQTAAELLAFARDLVDGES